MTPEEIEAAAAIRESAKVRAELLKSPGARLCPRPGCLVITQYGRLGADLHDAVVHPFEEAGR